MAIAFDACTGQQLAAGATSLTFAHTCTGTNRGLLVAVMLNTTSDRLTGITYNGTAMTLVDKQVVNSNYIQYVYKLSNPSSGANNVVVSVTPASNIFASATSYTGVDQSNLQDATNKNQSSTTSLAVAVTTVTDNAWVYGGGACDSNPAQITAGTNTTGRSIHGANDYAFAVDRNAVTTPAGSETLTVNSSATQGIGLILVAIKPVTSSRIKRLTLLGVS